VNQFGNAVTSFEFLVLGFEFKNLPNREMHEIREKEMKKIISTVWGGEFLQFCCAQK
jgi:hypothetical protein